MTDYQTVGSLASSYARRARCLVEDHRPRAGPIIKRLATEHLIEHTKEPPRATGTKMTTTRRRIAWGPVGDLRSVGAVVARCCFTVPRTDTE